MCVYIRNTLLLMLLAQMTASTEFALRLRKCRIDDNVELNSCLKHTFEELRPSLHTGIPELSLPPLEPMTLDRIVFRQRLATVNVEADFTNVLVRGLSDFTTTFVDANPTTRVLQVGLNIPYLRVTGQYKLSGSFFFLPTHGMGPFYANFDGVNVTGTSQMHVVVGSDGRQRLSVDQTNIDFTINKLDINLQNLFNGDDVLGRATNHFLNQNGKEILRELKPAVVQRLNELVQKVMNDALSLLPVSSFLITSQ